MPLLRVINVFLIIVLFTFFTISVTRIIKALNEAGKIIKHTNPYNQNPEDPSYSILVVGDSTGVGVGAKSPETSLAGYIGQDFPNIRIRNLSVSGLKMKDIVGIFKHESGNSYDLVLVQAGGNDIIYFTSHKSLKEDTYMALTEAHRLSQNVLFISTGNIGTAPVFLPPISWFYTYRTYATKELFSQTAKETQSLYIDLFKEKENDIFNTDPTKYYASDRLHPSEDGYAIWYRNLRQKMAQNNIFLK